MRAGDEDRERVVERLREAHVEGRLDGEELAERSELAYGTRFLDELPGLTADLPGARAIEPRRQRPSQWPARSGGGRPARRPPSLLLAILTVLAIVSVVAALASGRPPFGLFWIGLVAFIVMRCNRRPTHHDGQGRRP